MRAASGQHTPSPSAPRPCEVGWQDQRPVLRQLCAERRMHDAFQALEDAELRQDSPQKLAWYEAQYAQELATYTAVDTSALDLMASEGGQVEGRHDLK